MTTLHEAQEATGAALTPLLDNDDKEGSPQSNNTNNEDTNLMTLSFVEELAPREDEFPLMESDAVATEHMDEGRYNDHPTLLRYNPVATSSGTTGAEGVWKDSTCDWFVLVCVTLWCPIVALGQVMTRLRLDWLARPLPPTRQRYSTCFVVTCIVALPWLLHMISLGYMFHDEQQQQQDGQDDGASNSSSTKKHDYNPFQDMDIDIHFGDITIHPLDTWHSPLIAFLGLLIAIWRFYILCQTRRTIRRRDNIREELPLCCCAGWEDCCCACCCPHLAIYQMSRHTGDFRHHRAVCCHATGLVDRPTRQLPPVMV